MAKGKRRAEAAAKKRASKAARYARVTGQSKSRYAKKRRGQVAVNIGGPVVWCPGCYCRMCICSANAIERERERAEASA